MQIEIFDRSTREVIETVEADDMKSFRTYWSQQCNPVDYGFSVKSEEPAPSRHFIRREPNEHGSREPETLEMTDEVLAEIARLNASLTSDQVQRALFEGRTIYTSFSKYTLES